MPREHEAGREDGRSGAQARVSEATLYNWKAEYGGLDVSEARLKALEDENQKLKKLLAESMLDNAALKELLTKKMVGPAAKREAVAHLRGALEMIERRAGTIVAADRTMIRYCSRRPPETELRARQRELANQRRRFGYRRLTPSASIPTPPAHIRAEAMHTPLRATLTAPSPTMTRRSGSIPSSPPRSSTEATFTAPRATLTAPSPTTTRRSDSIPETPPPTSNGASSMPPRATPTAPSPTLTKRSALIPKTLSHSPLGAGHRLPRQK